jgi:hypothetical protein
MFLYHDQFLSHDAASDTTEKTVMLRNKKEEREKRKENSCQTSQTD